MPRPVDRNETTDLHAPWWSEAKDASGRYLERWVVRAHKAERDDQAIAEAMDSRMRMRQMASNGHRAKGGTSRTDNTEMEIAANLPFARLITLLQMTVEITDASGQPQHVSKDLINSMDSTDNEWVADELDRLYARPDVVPVLEEDHERAAMLREAADDGVSGIDPVETVPEGHAAKRFRSSL